MKTYDYTKAKQIIELNKKNLVSASLGMYEDWFWTTETIFENGEFKRELPDNAEELEEQFIKARKNGLSIFLEEREEDGTHKLNPEYAEYTAHQIAGLYGSDWATPAIQLYFKDGTEKMLACYNGTSSGTKPLRILGVLSGPVQEALTPLSDE